MQHGTLNLLEMLTSQENYWLFESAQNSKMEYKASARLQLRREHLIGHAPNMEEFMKLKQPCLEDFIRAQLLCNNAKSWFGGWPSQVIPSKLTGIDTSLD